MNKVMYFIYCSIFFVIFKSACFSRAVLGRTRGRTRGRTQSRTRSRTRGRSKIVIRS